MTALDRALIKAYRVERGAAVATQAAARLAPRFESTRTDAASTATLVFHSPEPVLAGPHRKPPRSVASVSLPAPGPVSSLSTYRNDAIEGITFRVDVGIAGTPAHPHRIPVAEPVEPPSAPPALPPALPDIAPVPAHTSTTSISEQPLALDLHTPVDYNPSEIQPDPVHLSSRPLSSYSPEELPVDEARPQLVVDRFAWPEVCDDLRAQSGGALAEFLATFLAETPNLRKTVALVGTDFGAGCTTTTLCLAQLLAAHGMRPAIIDADFARPSLADQLSVKVSHGWDAAISGAMPLGEVLIESLEDHLVLAPLGGPVPAEPLMAPSLRTSLLWRMLREPHDVLLFDAGTVEDEASIITLKSLVDTVPLDGVYAVCDVRSTPPQDLITFARHLKVAGIKLLGVIENFGGQWPTVSDPSRQSASRASERLTADLLTTDH